MYIDDWGLQNTGHRIVASLRQAESIRSSGPPFHITTLLGSEADGDGAGHGVISWRTDAGSVQDHPMVGQGGKTQGAGDEDESRVGE